MVSIVATAAMELSSVQHHDFDMEVHEVLQPKNLVLGSFLPPSFPPGLLEPLMVQELLNGRSSEPSVEQFDLHRLSMQANDCMPLHRSAFRKSKQRKSIPIADRPFSEIFRSSRSL